jgi:hypothetical protein
LRILEHCLCYNIRGSQKFGSWRREVSRVRVVEVPLLFNQKGLEAEADKWDIMIRHDDDKQ